MKPEPRYYVSKDSGSHFAYVIDRMTRESVRRFHILRGVGVRNGWNQAVAFCERMNLGPNV